MLSEAEEIRLERFHNEEDGSRASARTFTFYA